MARKLKTMPSVPPLPATIPSLAGMPKKKESWEIIGKRKIPIQNHPVILAGVANKPESHMTAMEKMDIVRLGVSKNDLENLKEIAALDYEELSKALLV